MTATAHARKQRRTAIQEILAAREVTTQAELAALLAARGIQTTPTTVGTDLRALGIEKVCDPFDGRVFYATPGEAGLPLVLSRLAREIEHGGGLVLIQTTPGGAVPVIAAAVEDESLPEVLTTFEGRRGAVLVVPRQGTSAQELAARLVAIRESCPERAVTS